MLAAVIIAISMSGCGSKSTTSTVEDIGFNETGLPIVNEPITFEVGVLRAQHIAPYDSMPLLKELEEKTNVHVKWREFPADSFTEQINLMFASEDYPDILWKGVTEDQILQYGPAGHMVELTELIEKYAPNWKKILDENDYIRQMTTAPDGKIYSLPKVQMNKYNSGYRDTWFINKQWLDKLGLKMPTNVHEYYEVLKAFKENDPNGNGEADEIPWTFIFYNYANGHFDIFGSFGELDGPQHVFVKDGKAFYTATSEANKNAIKYLNKLYNEGLIDPEVFTQNVSQFRAKLKSEPFLVGSFPAWNGGAELPLDKISGENAVYVPMPPLSGPNGEKAKFRVQTNEIERGYFTIFKNNKYPEVSMRWADQLVEGDFSMQALYGPLKLQQDGMYKLIEDPNSQFVTNVPANYGPFVVFQEDIERIVASPQEDLRREQYKIYEPYTVDKSEIYPRVFFTAEQKKILSTYETDLIEYVKGTHARWVTKGGIDEEWDEFVQKVNSMHLAEILEVYQEALDAFYQNK
jgi:putative aldouronate transport system substrate-binding protein